MVNYKFGKNYKLCSQKTITDIYENGSTVKCYPYIVNYKIDSFDDSVPFKIVISAPKRIFRKATARNRIKRIIKEAIRLNKSEFENFLINNDLKISMFLVYTNRQELDNATLKKRTIKLFQQLIKDLQNE